MKRTFAHEHRHALAVRLLAMNVAGFGVSGATHPNPPATCDLCVRDIASTSPFLVDGQTSRSQPVKRVNPVTGAEEKEEVYSWGDMCMDCYLREGRGVG